MNTKKADRNATDITIVDGINGSAVRMPFETFLKNAFNKICLLLT